MLRTLMVGLFPRAASIALGFLFRFCLAATAGEMTSSLLIGNARIDIVIEPTSPCPPARDIFRWVKSASESVTNYYGRFPAPRVLIRITPFEGRGVRNGMAFGDRDGRITIRVGNQISPSELICDWMLTHEMVNLAFPSVDENHHWIEEGIATYACCLSGGESQHQLTGKTALLPNRFFPQVSCDQVRDRQSEGRLGACPEPDQTTTAPL